MFSPAVAAEQNAGGVAKFRVLASSMREFRTMADHIADLSTEPRSDRELLAMVQIASTILRFTDLDDILAAITRELSQVIAFDRSSVAFMAPDGQSLTLRHVFKGDATADRLGEGRRISLNESSIVGWVATHRTPLLRSDIASDGRFLEIVKEEQLQSDMVVPLVAHGQLIGTINVGCYTRGALTERDLGMLVNCGNIASAAIEHALLLRDAKELNERHKLLRHNARDMIMLIDRNTGGIIEVNRKCCEALGYPEETLLDMTYFDLFTDDNRFQAKRDFVNILSLKTRSLVDRRFQASDGTVIHVDISADLMKIHSDTFVQVLVHDVSERKLLEQQVILQNKNLQEANRRLTEVDRMKSEFLQNISHELRTPLSIIIAYAESLKDDSLSPASRREFLGILEENGQSLLRLINDLLDLSNLETSGAMLALTPTHLHDVIRSVWPMAEVEARKKRINLGFTPGSDVPICTVDNKRIQQVIGCLIQNALKFTEAGGVVEVSTHRREHEVWVSVQDTGAGISTDHLEHIFDAFHQIDGSATRRWGGLGIGLAMAKHIVELHNGDIWVESEEGRGSTFTVVLPLVSTNEKSDDRFQSSDTESAIKR